MQDKRRAIATPIQAASSSLSVYDAGCRAIANAVAVDEVKDIRDQAVAMAAYARQAKNRDLEADAVALRMRATRCLDQMFKAQRDTVGFNRGAAAGGSKTGSRGVLIPRVTYAQHWPRKGSTRTLRSRRAYSARSRIRNSRKPLPTRAPRRRATCAASSTPRSSRNASVTAPTRHRAAPWRTCTRSRSADSAPASSSSCLIRRGRLILIRNMAASAVLIGTTTR
jgi:hypothetical protein